MVNNYFFLNRAIYEIMWRNTVEPDMSHITIWRLRITCWIHEPANTHSTYVTLTPRQQ